MAVIIIRPHITRPITTITAIRIPTRRPLLRQLWSPLLRQLLVLIDDARLDDASAPSVSSGWADAFKCVTKGLEISTRAVATALSAVTEDTT